MKTLKYVSLLLITLAFIMGCSGNYGKLKTQSVSDSKATQRELIDNWLDYNISLNYSRAPGLNLIIFDPKNDNRKIFLAS